MWDCEHCGTTNIAGSLEVCPHCQEPRTQEPVEVAASTEGAEEGTTPEVELTPSTSSPSQPATDSKEGW